ncbi:MAG: hypothetical protein KF716_08725 [Anaerolineae bacterium]|nr:hypothetical protein [Anaerolineae bacterium]
MSDLTYDAKKIRPLHQATTMPPKLAAATGGLGDVVTINTSDKATKSANDSGKGLGLVVSAEHVAPDGTFAANKEVVICVFGPVTGFSGLTPGKLVYLSATAGRLATTGTVPFGYAWDANTVFVMPGVADSAS